MRIAQTRRTRLTTDHLKHPTPGRGQVDEGRGVNSGSRSTKAGGTDTHIACARCGYDRYGSAVDGACPECGGMECTRYFVSRRRVRRLAGVALALGAMELCLAVGVRGCFAYHRVSMGDFAAVGATQPSSGVWRATPLVGLMVHSTNALCCGASSLFVCTLLLLAFAVRIGETRGVGLTVLTLIMLGAAMWFGSEQSAALDL